MSWLGGTVVFGEVNAIVNNEEYTNSLMDVRALCTIYIV